MLQRHFGTSCLLCAVEVRCQIYKDNWIFMQLKMQANFSLPSNGRVPIFETVFLRL